MNFQKILIATAAAIALAGCATTSGIEVGRDYVRVDDPAFASKVKILHNKCEKNPEGFLHVQVEVKNICNGDFSFLYCFEWRDENGMIQTHQPFIWRQKELHGGEVWNLDGVSSLQNATDFRLKLRWLDKQGPEQKSLAVTELVEKMVNDPDVAYVYATALERAKSNGHPRPTIIVHNFSVGSGAGDESDASQMQVDVKIALQKTQKFSIVGKSESMYEAGDFFMFGELTRERGDIGGKDYHNYITLWLSDPVAKVELWRDKARIGK